MTRRTGLTYLAAILLFSLLFVKDLKAQQGFFLQPYFMYQYTTIANNRDQFNKDNYKDKPINTYFTLKSTYRPAYGISALWNITNAFGLDFGIKYSMQGQKYEGYLLEDGNFPYDTNVFFTSQVDLNYLEVPILLTFNSLLGNIDDERDALFLSIGMGIQLDFLSNSSMTVSPAPIISEEAQSDFDKLFNNFTISFAGKVSLNGMLGKRWMLNGAFFASKSLGEIENKDFVFDKSKYPLEYQFPVSVKKEEVSGTPRLITKNMVLGLSVSISYLIFR